MYNTFVCVNIIDNIRKLENSYSSFKYYLLISYLHLYLHLLHMLLLLAILLSMLSNAKFFQFPKKKFSISISIFIFTTYKSTPSVPVSTSCTYI
jgi:hypothetical protein